MANNIKSKLSLLVFGSVLLLTSLARGQSESKLDTPPAPAPANGNGSAADLAKTLANPIGALISVPLQTTSILGAGPDGDGFQYKLNLQPIIPFSLNEDWLLISRTILPVVYQENIIGTSSQAGLSDTVQSFFLSPVKPTQGGWIWGAGPAPAASNRHRRFAGRREVGAGPTAVVLKQQNGWTCGALANHIWSFAGESDRAEVNATYLQPFVSFTTKKATTFTLNTESTYDWHGGQWSVPMNFMVQQLVKIGKQPIALTVGARYYPEGPSQGPDWGLRFAVIFLFPK